MQYNSVVIFTTGAPGSGKTYSRCARFLWDFWLPERKGVHYSNFPVKVEKFAEKYSDATERIKIIPKEELDRWTRYESGPWDYFRDVDLEGAHIAIDECHNFIKRTGEGCQKNATRWEQWLGEIRHRGCTVEFLSQDPHKVSKCIDIHSGVRIALINSEDRRDPWFGILLGDWYELRAGLAREYETVIWQVEERRVNSKWVHSHTERFTLKPFYFELYDSFNTPHSGGTKATGQEREYQKRRFPALLLWFVRRNVFRLASRAVIVVVFIWLCFCGGLNWLIFKYIGYSNLMAGANRVERSPVDPPPHSEMSATKSNVVEAPRPSSPATALAPVLSREQPGVPTLPTPLLPVAKVDSAVQAAADPGRAQIQDAKHADVQPRTVLGAVSRKFAALSDGRLLRLGEQIGDWTLVHIDYARRACTFRGSDGKEELVPVGASLRR